MLEAINLTKRYNGTAALDALDLKIEPGEVFCLLGANGAGKTTTINLFLNFIDPTSGAARIKGLDVVERPLETKKYIAYIPEQVMLYKNLSGLENLEYFSALAGHEEYTRGDLLGFFREVGLQEEAADRGASGLTRRACARRSGSRSRSPRRPRPCSSTSRPRASTRRPRTSSPGCSKN